MNSQFVNKICAIKSLGLLLGNKSPILRARVSVSAI